ncbi:hypothetical protein [Actinosynnema sp. NPDC020468]|uniref:hypothetical protein n=1 Tax=Actinosynnema sp. NPDC020468 TaxID=3154488 RepID=UPI00340D9443
MTRLAAAIAIVGLVSTAASGVAQATSASPRPAVAGHGVEVAVSHDARTVFRGAFFGHGPVGERLSAHFPGLPAETADTTAAEDLIIDAVVASRPDVVENLHRAVVAGKHGKTRQALVAAVDPLHQAVAGLGGVPVAAGPPASGDCAAVLILVAAWAAVAVWVAVALPFAVVDTDRSDLDLDELASDLVTASRI